MDDLINCPDCGARTNRFAVSCLKCGRPIKGYVKVRSTSSALGLTLLLIGMGLVAYFVVAYSMQAR